MIPKYELRHDTFNAGGFNLTFPPGVRTRLYAKLINRPGWQVQLHSYGFQSQTVVDFFLWEFLVNGRTIFREDAFCVSGAGIVLLPFFRFDAVGLCEMYATMPGGATSEVSGHVWGQYVPRV